MAKKSSRQELEDSRRARAEKLRSAQQKQERRRGLIIWAAVGLVVVLIAGGTTYGVLSQGGERDELLSSIDEFEETTTEHVQSEVNYPQTPPVGGQHNPVWLNCGVYDEPVQDENAVHSLEHGAVWVAYDPGLPEDDVETLRDAMPPTYAILSPYPDLPAPVVASAWGKQIQLDGADDPRLEQFVREFSGSSDVPEPGALCTGGTDTATPLTGEPVEG